MTAGLLRLAGLFDGDVRHDGPVDVLVRDGRILSVSRAGSAPADRDLSDAFAVPGLVDCHCHLATEPSAPLAERFSMSPERLLVAARRNAATVLGTGVTLVADCGGRDEVIFAVRAEIAAGDSPGPTVLAAGRPVCAPGGHDMGIGEIVGNDVGPRDAVLRRIAAGSDFIKVMLTPGGGEQGPRTYFDLAQLTEIVATAHAHDVRVTVHAHDPDGIAIAVEAGVDGIEHATFLREGSVVADVTGRRALAAAGRAVCPTNAIDHRKLAAGEPGAPRADLVRSWRATIDAGVPIVGGSDVGVPMMRFDDYALVPELMVHELGLSPIAALHACTAAAADYLGAVDAGRLTPGSRADLLVLDTDPTVDIGALRNPRAVLKDGRWLRENQLVRTPELATAGSADLADRRAG